ncbi:RBBP9/YdeN family alpha/beta hydrolase [Cohaesibacter celericrescens]|uniref:Alpha/beta hydrolase n=1 Tax=Cohaesibacter celericrescens TaxID=2067669 RepID=A0A2N5XWA5_9HYPH|nr:alpha/beta hydrolase [Cohaesibacter celericrescens]PLW78791.1 alpha/beta hydrolase [Cohaesibacter celericrescens]
MKASEADIFIIPGLDNSGPDHWQSRWEAKIRSARRIEQADWSNPQLESWVSTILRDVEAANRPAVLVAHSLGVVAAVKAAHAIKPGLVKGAFLVGLPNVESDEHVPELIRHFAPIPEHKLPFPSILVASRSDPYCAYDTAVHYGNKWGSTLVDAGETGHINDESGQGPWPEGLMTFANFMRDLS